MRPDDWAHTTETTVGGMNAGYVHGIVRDMNNGKIQGPVRIIFESTAANEVSLREHLMLMDQELKTSCARMLEIKDGLQFPTGAVAQLLTAAARKRATMPYDFDLTYVIDTFTMRRFAAVTVLRAGRSAYRMASISTWRATEFKDCGPGL